MVAFWFQTQEDRDVLCQEVLNHRGSSPIFPVVLRGRGFDDPNMVIPDLMAMVNANRHLFEDFKWERTSEPVAVLLISRSQLGVAQLSSPAVLPRWFPRAGGQIVTLRIHDLARSAIGAIQSPEADIQGLQQAVFELEIALIRRLERVREVHPGKTDALFATLLGNNNPAAPEMFLSGAKARIYSVADPRSYRSDAGPTSVSGRIIKLATQTSPNDLLRVADLLGEALAAPDPAFYRVDESLPVLIMRSLKVVDTAEWHIRFGRNLVGTAFAVHQLLNAASHSWEFPQYALELLAATSRNLKETMIKISTNIEQMNAVQPPCT